LLWRLEPEARRLRLELEDALDSHWQQLPAEDSAHPLLKHRNRRPRLRGSWSVRLTGGGFHLSHMHPHGLLSSASYWALPDSDPTDPQAGILELGRPPKELGLDLEPLAILEPKPGHLALFPSTLMHGTRPFPKGERLTLAFDVVAS
jgi:Putative 2OG-Fe(II) oxygenase